MELARDNNYSIADDTVLNVTSLMECTDAQRLSLDEMSFGEFASTNVPTLLKGSRATVNGALFKPAPADGVPLFIANAAGSTFQDVSAAPADTTLYLCLVPGTDTATYALKACASVYYNTEWRGWYETGAQNRVFGECRKVSGAWPVAYKRRYFHPSTIEAYCKTYSDGLEINARKISPVNLIGRIPNMGRSRTYSGNRYEQTIDLCTIDADYPLVVEIVASVRTWCDGSTLNLIISGCEYRAVLCDADKVTEVGCLSVSPLTGVPGSKSAAIQKTNLLSVPVGTSKIKLKTVVKSEGPYQYGLNVGTVSVYVRNVYGDRTGGWGKFL